MAPLRGPRRRSTRWQVAMAHGHYEPPAPRANPLRPSWVFGDEEIAATAADYLALGHWDRPMRVGDGVVPAYYSGSRRALQVDAKHYPRAVLQYEHRVRKARPHIYSPAMRRPKA